MNTRVPAAGAAMSSSRHPNDLHGALPWLVIAAAFVHALAMSWRKWGDLCVDTGRELDLPRRLAEGQLLYRDARYYYGPLAPYLNALLYRVFGVHLDVVVWAGILSAALMAVALWRLSRFFLRPWAAAAIPVAFIYLCAFAHPDVGPIFNFVLPYTYAATYGIVAAVWSLVFLVEHVRSGRPAAFFLSTACLAMAALSKIEAVMPAAASHVIFVASLFWTRSSRRRVYAAGYGGAVAVVLWVYGFFWLSVGPQLWRQNLLGVINPGSEKFVLSVMGLLGLKGSLEGLALSGALLVATLAVAAAESAGLARHDVPPLAGYALCVAVAVAAFAGYRFWQLHVHFRALPLLMAIVIAALAVLYGKKSERRSEWLTHLLLWVFGFAALWRILLNAKPQHYGFYLLPAGLLCFGVAVFAYGPRLAARGPWTTNVFAAAGIGVLASSVSLAIADSKEFYGLHTYEISTARGRLKILNRWRLEGPALDALSQLPRETRLLTVPEGSGFLYFAGLRECDTMFSYLPMEVPDAQADEDLLSRWRSNPPEIVAWVGIPLAEFGSHGFGFDYAYRSMAWVHENYVAVSEPSSAIVFMVRRDKLGKLRVPDLRPTPQSSDALRSVTGQVLEYYDADNVSFVRLAVGETKLWAAVPATRLSVGSSLTIYALRRGAVQQAGFRRRFETVFAGRLAPDGPAVR